MMRLGGPVCAIVMTTNAVSAWAQGQSVHIADGQILHMCCPL